MNLRSLPRDLVLLLIVAYQKLVSPTLAPRCRFRPTCSEYASQAIERFGLMDGSWLAIKRLGRCHPLRPGGFDPVPDEPRLVRRTG